MKVLVIFCVLIALAVADYESLDNFDSAELVANERLLKSYGLCFIDQGPCTAEGKKIKKIIPDALQTSCDKCSAKQRPQVRDVSNAFKQKLPSIWEQLLDLYDPNHEHRQNIEKFLNSSD